ncbi:MAG: four helix bundle protein [Verrucomicrobiae bacterium]|nr:four helix bundle protein [Verrucomicrobiae bacterium]
MRDHTKLRAFILADEVAMLIYQATRRFPKEELYGLASQMKRAAVSIPSNIVEGCARESHVEYFRFLEIAFGSLRELDYQCNLAKRLGYFDKLALPGLEAKIQETGKVLAALLRSLRPLNNLTANSLTS